MTRHEYLPPVTMSEAESRSANPIEVVGLNPELFDRFTYSNTTLTDLSLSLSL